MNDNGLVKVIDFVNSNRVKLRLYLMTELSKELIKQAPIENFRSIGPMAQKITEYVMNDFEEFNLNKGE